MPGENLILSPEINEPEVIPAKKNLTLSPKSGFIIPNDESNNVYHNRIAGDQPVYRFKASDNRINANGWKVITEGIKIGNYQNNPLVFWNHDYFMPPIGKAVKVFKENDELFIDVIFNRKFDLAILIESLVADGFIKCCSIGYKVLKMGEPETIPAAMKNKLPSWLKEIKVHEESDLKELSVVNFGANIAARFKERANSLFESGIIKNSLQDLQQQYDFISEIIEDYDKDQTVYYNYKQERISIMTDKEIQEMLKNNALLESENTGLKAKIEKLNSDLDNYGKDSKEIQTLTEKLNESQKEADNLQKQLTDSLTANKALRQEISFNEELQFCQKLRNEGKIYSEPEIAEEAKILTERKLASKPGENGVYPEDSDYMKRRKLLSERKPILANGETFNSDKAIDENGQIQDYSKLNAKLYNEPAIKAELSKKARQLSDEKKITFSQAMNELLENTEHSN